MKNLISLIKKEIKTKQKTNYWKSNDLKFIVKGNEISFSHNILNVDLTDKGKSQIKRDLKEILSKLNNKVKFISKTNFLHDFKIIL